MIFYHGNTKKKIIIFPVFLLWLPQDFHGRAPKGSAPSEHILDSSLLFCNN